MIFSLPFTEGYKQKMIHYSTQILQSGPVEFKPSLSGKHSAVGALQCPSHWTPSPHSKRLLLELWCHVTPCGHMSRHINTPSWKRK